MNSAEQEARSLLKRMDIDGADKLSAGDLVELANLLSDLKLAKYILLECRQYVELANHEADLQHEKELDYQHFEEMQKTESIIALIDRLTT